MSALDAALQFARDNHPRFLDEYRALLALPSISTLPEHKQDVLDTADWVAAQLREHGMTEVEIVPTAGHPIIFASWLGAPGKPTVLVYGHYDVQPVDPLNEWESGPFAGEIRGDYIFARGASDMKGQIFAQIKALESLVKTGQCPVNIKYMIEGEEEIGSPNLQPFIEANLDRLKADFVLNCDAGIHSPDVPAITYSLRGLAYFELEIRTAAKDMHSGLFGGSVYNPIHVLAELIAGMHDAQGRVTLPGFYDRVRELDAEERALLQRVPYSDERWQTMTGTQALYGEAGYSTIERVGARPTLEVNGIWGGFIEEGAKTVLPARASAKISTRLVADQRPEEIYGILKAHLETRMPAGIDWRLHQHSCGAGAIMDRKSAYMQSAEAALKTVFGKDPIFKREGGSVPVVSMLQQKLGIDSIMLGFALPDDGIHGPNERQYLPNFYRGIDTYIHFLLSL
ncbi:MAG: dipeptidase [Candidatus Hydrogenedentes bacterium]|nr:dipeptidase [Candidatus Hydrogenedentota bacterium]